MKRFLELDALRGLCALGVMTYHFALRAPQMYVPGLEHFDRFQWGYYRVQMFCLLSGFVMALVVERGTTPRAFLRSRFSRLYPAYFVAVLATSLLVTAVGLPDRAVTPGQVLVNLTMAQTFLGARNVDSAYWFLAPELAFYLAMLVLLVSGQYRRVEAIGLAALVVFTWNGNLYGTGHVPLPELVELSRLPSLWHLFFAGILFHRLHSQGSHWRRHALLAACFGAQWLTTDDDRLILSMAFCFLVVYLFLAGGLAWIVHRFTLWLGAVSYSLFLVHENVGFTVIWECGKLGWPAPLRLALAVLISVAAAAALHYGVERPARRRLA